MLIAEELEPCLDVPVEVVPMEELESILESASKGTVVTSRYFLQPVEELAKRHGVRANLKSRDIVERLLRLGVTPPGAEAGGAAPEAAPAAPEEAPAATPTVADLVSRYEQAVGGYTPLWEREGAPARPAGPAPAAEEEGEEERRRRGELEAFERGRESGRWQRQAEMQLQALGDKWEEYKQSPIRRHTPGRPALTPRPTPNNDGKRTPAGARSLRRAASVKSAQKLTFGAAAARRERSLSVSPAIRKKKGGGGGSTPRAKLAEQRHRARLARQPRF